MGKYKILLVLVLVFSVFFRFYNFFELQYWSGDEEIQTAVVRHIVWDRSPMLLIPNSNLGVGLGPYYHWLLAPVHYVLDFNMPLVFALASALGVFCTYLMFLAGKALGGYKLGLISSFLYSCSFLIALYDRRLWPLSLDSVLSVVAFFGLSKVVVGKLRFMPLLVLPVGFSLHSDPSLLVLFVAIVACLVFFRVSLKNRYALLSILAVGIFALPLLLAEVRYSGTVSKSFVNVASQPLKSQAITNVNLTYFDPVDIGRFFSKVLFVAPSDFVEQEFCYCKTPDSPLGAFGIAVVFLVISISFISLFWPKAFGVVASSIKVLWIIFGSFIFGIGLYNYVFKGNFNEHYLLVVLPVFVLMLAQFFNIVLSKSKLMFFALVGLFLFLNLYSLVKSSVAYPLYRKIEMVRVAKSFVGDSTFALNSSENPYIHGGGFNELFILERANIVRSYWYDFFGWIYSAYSLYPKYVSLGTPEKVVSIVKEDEIAGDPVGLIGKHRLKDVIVVVHK